MSLIVIAANRWLSAQAGRISGATIAQNINSSLRSVLLTGPSRGGMFGCIAAQAQIIVVDTQLHMILDKVRFGRPSTQFVGTSSWGVILGASAACTTNW